MNRCSPTNSPDANGYPSLSHIRLVYVPPSASAKLNRMFDGREAKDNY